MVLVKCKLFYLHRMTLNSKYKNTIRDKLRERAFYLGTFNNASVMLFEQRALHLHSALALQIM